MASPFPGMDPFLEDPAFWLDFHNTFVNYWREAIADALPEAYEAGIDERVYLVETDPDVRKLIKPDVGILGSELSTGAVSSRSGVATLEPVTVPLALWEGPREAYIEILHRPERSLVAVLELLSPANKNAPGRTEYLSKRNGILRQNVHLVELDLLLGGKRVPMDKPLPAGDCYYLLARAEARPDCQVYAWPLEQALPRLPVPLRAPDADVMIDLAAVFATAYERGRFARRLRYGAPCPAPVTEPQQAWALSLLGERTTTKH